MDYLAIWKEVQRETLVVTKLWSEYYLIGAEVQNIFSYFGEWIVDRLINWPVDRVDGVDKGKSGVDRLTRWRVNKDVDTVDTGDRIDKGEDWQVS